MSKNIKLTQEFLEAQFENSAYLKNNPEVKEYRLRHSIRVANIGAEIAIKEGMDAEAMTIACLLHDISYMNEFKSESERKGHGRASAAIAKAFLNQLDLSEHLKQEICYGIAIHVDGKSDFEGVSTPFAETIGDSDNIDRFDVYRIYENLQNSHFSELVHDEQLEYVDQMITKINKLNALDFGSCSATEMWRERLIYQHDFFQKLKNQIQLGNETRLNMNRG